MILCDFHDSKNGVSLFYCFLLLALFTWVDVVLMKDRDECTSIKEGSVGNNEKKKHDPCLFTLPE